MTYQELFQRAGIAQFEEVDIEGLGRVRIKKLTAADHVQKERLFQEHGSRDAQGNLMVEPLRLAMLDVRLAVVDEDGRPFLDESQVAALPKDTVYALFHAINLFNKDGLATEADAAAKKS